HWQPPVYTGSLPVPAPMRASPSVTLLGSLRRLAAWRQRRQAGVLRRVADQAGVDLAVVGAGLEHHDPHPAAEAEVQPAALAAEHLPDRIELVVVVRQLGDVDQAVDLGLVQLPEQAEAGDAADHAIELAADVLLHPRRAVALVDLALGLVGAALALGALQRQPGHVAGRVLVGPRL